MKQGELNYLLEANRMTLYSRIHFRDIGFENTLVKCRLILDDRLPLMAKLVIKY